MFVLLLFINDSAQSFSVQQNRESHAHNINRRRLLTSWIRLEPSLFANSLQPKLH